MIDIDEKDLIALEEACKRKLEALNTRSRRSILRKGAEPMMAAARANVRDADDEVAAPAIELVKKMASSGFYRKRLPKEFLVVNGGAGQATAMSANPVAAAGVATAVAGAAVAPMVSTAAVATSSAVALDRRAEARMKGYEGDACGECGNFTLVRNGTCLKCDTCGSTSGCS